MADAATRSPDKTDRKDLRRFWRWGERPLSVTGRSIPTAVDLRREPLIDRRPDLQAASGTEFVGNPVEAGRRPMYQRPSGTEALLRAAGRTRLQSGASDPPKRLIAVGELRMKLETTKKRTDAGRYYRPK